MYVRQPRIVYPVCHKQAEPGAVCVLTLRAAPAGLETQQRHLLTKSSKFEPQSTEARGRRRD